MRTLRSLTLSLLLVISALGVVAATPSQADAYWYRGYGGYSYPHYWGGYGYRPYANFYRYGYGAGYGLYGGYNSYYPYYNAYGTYPWGWYY